MYWCEYSLLTTSIVLAHKFFLGSFAAISIFLIYLMEPLVKSIRRVIRRVKSRPSPDTEASTSGETDLEKQQPAMGEPPLIQVNGHLPYSSSIINCSESAMRNLSSESFEIIHPLHRCFERSGSTPDITNSRVFWNNKFVSESELEHMGGGRRPTIVKRVTTGLSSISHAGSRLSLQRPRSALLRNSSTPSVARLSFLEGLPSIKGISGLNTLDELVREDGTPGMSDHHDDASIFGPPIHSSTPTKRSPYSRS